MYSVGMFNLSMAVISRGITYFIEGYAGYYGLSLIAGSYAVLFVSLAAHAAQFAFLLFFENPRMSTLALPECG